MKPKHLKNLLLSEINSVSERADVFSFDSGKFFTRKRKLPFETVIKTIIGMESKSLTNEIIDAFEAEPGMPTASAFVQQRCKIKPEAFKTIFDGFTSKLVSKKDGVNGIKSGLELPACDVFDVPISLKLSRKQTNEMKERYIKDKNHYKFIPHSTPFDYLDIKLRKSDPLQYYELDFRVVRFKISDDSYETVLTNLDIEEYPPNKLKELYSSRWGIETSFRDLKYTIGMLDFHSKKVMCIHQEIYAHLIMYNFAEMITSHVVIENKQRKYTYKANFSVAAHMCRLFYQGKTTSPNLETIISRNIIPVRPDRHRERKLTVKVFHGFLYRVA